ncbi:MAG: MATE family efflux transporter [Oscillospiraceae bacterium]|nr:MATE family efflux transporter [Oscillospiraceae bacterium]
MDRTPFFSKNKAFYKAFFSMMAVVALQNLVAYSVNMADNVMLGRFSQEALSGAATVNQIFFIVQQFALSFGNALVAVSSQYWGEKRTGPLRTLTGVTLKLSAAVALVIVVLCLAMPGPLLSLFTSSPAIIAEGKKYLAIIVWTFLLFMISQVLMAALRSVGTVRISFYISVVSLVVNVGINYVLIFGKLGFPRMGITGAAIGTLIARAVELVIVLWYVAFREKKVRFLGKGTFARDRVLFRDYIRIYIPIMCASVLWGFSVPIQTAILGHLSADAIAANSVATTFYQYLKVIVMAVSSTSAALIGKAIGEGDLGEVKAEARTMSVIDVVIGLILGAALVALRRPLLSLYSLEPSAMELSDTLIIIMGFVMVGMSYQMPVSFGLIMGGGDGKFTMKMNLISTWAIVTPLSFMAAFWWKWPVWLVVIVVQSDQIFKCLPTFIHFRKYGWIKKLTRPDA